MTDDGSRSASKGESMKLLTYRAASCLGVAAVAGGVAIAATPSAAAAAPNKGIGVQATGALVARPVVVSTFPGTGSNHAAGLSILPLIETGAMDTAAGSTTA